MRKPVRLATAAIIALLLAGCSTTAASTAPLPASSAAEPEGVTTADACAQMAETSQLASKTLEIGQSLEKERMDSAKTSREKRQAFSMAGGALASYEDKLTQLYASLWPQVADPDLKDILKALSRDIYDEPNATALNGMCSSQ